MKELINETVALYTKTKNNKCICDECGDEVDSSWGDVRKEVFRFDSKDQKVPSSIRMVCPSCIEDLFGDHSPNSIFDGTPDWMIMGS